jgi:SAM-dependent methyltransferase
MATDPFVDFKQQARAGWARYAPLATFTKTSAAHLARVAGVKAGQHVLDVGCGTGSVALTARRIGARVTGLDLTPELLAIAKEQASLAMLDDVTWKEGDAENLPFRDGEFDAVLSQFGHMFAPRAAVATKEMLRVLKPGGTLAFSTWDPAGATGANFSLLGRHLPPPPAGMDFPLARGEPAVVRERLGKAVKDIHFERGQLQYQTVSPRHMAEEVAQSLGPVLGLRQMLANEPAKWTQFMREFEAAHAPYFDAHDNVVRLDYIVTRATKV